MRAAMIRFCSALALAASGLVQAQLADVTQPGDPIISTSSNSPGDVGPFNAIDNDPTTKYINFDKLNTGFTVVPQVGMSVVSGLTVTSGNDAPERDPASFILFGSYDWTNLTAIASGNLPAFTDRRQKQTILFENKIPYLQYKLIFPTLSNVAAAVAMQVTEVELLGVAGPLDVTRPGDPMVAIPSNNSPGTEGVANAIDDGPFKYLSFAKLNSGFLVVPDNGASIVVGLTLTSANDHPERDPASYMLEGSNDPTNFLAISDWTPISSGSVPLFPTRFHKNYLFFPDNTNAFTTYRLRFPTVVDAVLANSMQIAEVELLGTRPGFIGPTNCAPGTLIQRQPQDTPVLSDARATFRVGLTGPWRVQWYRNGEAITGATTPTYVTPPMAVENDGARYHAQVRNNLCYEDSDEVVLTLFTPSTTESIGLNFVGQGGASGPFPMRPDDITGLHRQAYWENLGGISGFRANPTNSNHQPHPSITVQWACSGEWNAGLDWENAAAERLLAGLATSYATNETAAQSVRFTGVPHGNHSLLLYSVQVPLEFFSMDFQVITFRADGGVKSIQQRFIRPENGNEYNIAPGFRLVTAETPATRAVGNTMRFDNVQPDDGRIQIRFFSPDRHQPPPPAEQFRGPGVSGLQLLLRPAEMLRILMTSSDQVLLWWPATETSYALEATESLHPSDWHPVPEAPTLQGDRFELRLPFRKAQEYFRLRH
jgi:hypothetical protein